MDLDSVTILFQLFVGDEAEVEDYSSIISMAILEVEQMLRDSAEESDTRLNFLAAAIATLRYVEITAARDRAACTFAGTVAQNTDAQQKLMFAKELVAIYRVQCRDLLKDNLFFFHAV
ncbi:MAG: hypothetical protein LIO74_10280 [Ruminococcus sp.]|nr:hypothetical protein [Ruminococcus sp.]